MKYNFTAAVIGTGYMGKKHIAVLNETVENLIICGNDEATGKALAEEYGCKFYVDYCEMFEKEKIDIVSICLPTHLHCTATLCALDHGVNVLCEKPFASNADEAAEMLKLAKEKDLLFMIGHVVRFSKNYEYIRRCVVDKRFGKLISFNASREDGTPAWSVGNWLNNAALSGGVVRDLHIHDTDMIVGLLGMPKSVFTIGNDTICRTLYKYDDAVAYAGAAFRPIGKVPSNRGMDVVFEKAWIKVRGKNLTVYVDNDSFEPLETEEFSEFFGDNGVQNEIRYFCHCLANGEEPLLCMPDDSLKTMTVNTAEYESLKKSCEVFI